MTIRVAAIAAVVVALLQMGGPAWSSEVAWRKDVAAATRESGSTGKPLLVMVKARWCGPCHRMLRESFPDSAVAARVQANFIPLLIDADEQPALIQKLNINAFPTMLVLDSSQKVAERVTGFQSAAQLNWRLAAIRPAQPRIAQRPAYVAQSPRPGPVAQNPAKKPSFHDRVWASIRNSAPRERQSSASSAASPIPHPDTEPPVPWNTFAIARAFGLVP